MKTLRLERAESTNCYVKEHAGSLDPMTLVYAVDQTAGRGQRGNSWEAEPAMNLTLSFYFRPEGVKPAEQFAVSEAVALAVASLLDGYGIDAKVKWPNDIYVADRKICGILIENSIMGTEIARCVVGIGLNVNQEVFLSDAPNPVSMKMITRQNYDLVEVMEALGETLESYLGRLDDREGLKREYMARLWRNDGRDYPFAATVSSERFMARIEDVAPTGHLHLLRDGIRHTYAFKEIAFLPTNPD